MDEAALWTLASWCSPGFPTGAFAWSHGLEAAVARGEVRDAAGLRDWIAAVIAHGAGRTDAILLAMAARDPGAEGPAALARALQAGAERLAESEGQGRAFAATVAAVTGRPLAPACLPVAFGRAVAAAGLPLGPALLLHLHAFAANLVSAGVRLVPLGQTEGQQVLAALLPVCRQVAAEAPDSGEADLGGAAFLADLAALRHETLEPRLFRS